jgi:hypothetical protein
MVIRSYICHYSIPFHIHFFIQLDYMHMILAYLRLASLRVTLAGREGADKGMGTEAKSCEGGHR